MKKTGQLLREAREARGISLQEVSVHLKINSRILRALEEGDLTQLPAKTFLRGFVQSYAQFLRVDTNEVLDIFQAEVGTTHPKMITKQVEMAAESAKPPTPSYIVETKEPVATQNNVSQNETRGAETVATPKATTPQALSVDHKTWSHSMKIGTVGLIIVIGFVIYGVIRTIDKYEREAQVVQPPPLDLQAVPRTENLPDVVPLATISPEQVDVAVANQSAQAIAPAATPNLIVSPTPSPLAAAATPKPSATPEASVLPPVSRPQEVIIEALDRVVVEYSIDDKPKATIVLSPEKVHTFRGEKKLSLGFSDGGSINLIYNGKDKGVPGNLGKPLKLNFPE